MYGCRVRTFLQESLPERAGGEMVLFKPEAQALATTSSPSTSREDLTAVLSAMMDRLESPPETTEEANPKSSRQESGPSCRMYIRWGPNCNV